MFFFLMLVVMFLSLLCMMVNNLVVWWSVFLLMTVIFVLLNKDLGSYSSLFNYFVLQECLGLLFLLFFFGNLQLIILLLKVGVSPLHFWIFSVLNEVVGLNLVWFLTMQKLPFLLVLLQFLSMFLMGILLFGLLVCLLQMLLTKSMKNLLILSSTESFNWVLVGFGVSVVGVLFIFFYYFFLMLLLIPKFEYEMKSVLGWEVVLVFMNLPFSVNFFVKIFSLIEFFKSSGFVMLFVLFLLFMSILSLSYWLVSLSVNNFLENKLSKAVGFFIVPMMFLIVL